MKNCWHRLCYIGDGLAVPFRTHHTIITTTTAQAGGTAKLLAIVYYLSPWKQMCQAQFDLDGYLNANGPLYIYVAVRMGMWTYIQISYMVNYLHVRMRTKI